MSSCWFSPVRDDDHPAGSEEQRAEAGAEEPVPQEPPGAAGHAQQPPQAPPRAFTSQVSPPLPPPVEILLPEEEKRLKLNKRSNSLPNEKKQPAEEPSRLFSATGCQFLAALMSLL